MSDTSDIKYALNQLSLIAGQFKPHSIGYLKGFEPDRADMRDFQDEIDILSGAFDRVIEAWAKVREQEGILSAADVRLYATNVVRDALAELRAEVENGIEQRIDDLEYAR